MNIDSYKQRKNRGISVEDLIKSLEEEKHEIDSIAVVTITKDKEIELWISTDNSTEMLGAVEVAKNDLVHFINDYE